MFLEILSSTNHLGAAEIKDFNSTQPVSFSTRNSFRRCLTIADLVFVLHCVGIHETYINETIRWSKSSHCAFSQKVSEFAC